MQTRLQLVRDWLVAGPFDLDVSSRYTDNYHVPTEPYLSLIEEAAEGAAALRPEEGEERQLWGQSQRWRRCLAEPQQERMIWARFGKHARLMVMHAFTTIAVEQAGTYEVELYASGTVRLWVNEESSFEHTQLGRVSGTHRLRLRLHLGENRISLLLANVHLHCTTAFALVLAEDAAWTQGQLDLLVSGKQRDTLLLGLETLGFERQLLSGSERIRLQWHGSPPEPQPLKARLYRSRRGLAGEQVAELQFERTGASGEKEWLRASELPGPGEYSVVLHSLIEGGRELGELKLTFQRLDWQSGLQAHEDYEARRQAMLRMMADNGSGIYRELAKMESDRWAEVDYGAIETDLQYMNDRYDCADFVMHGLLRMLFKHGDDERLPAELKARMKECVLNFKYGEDEPGRSMMFTRSENHEMLFYSAQYLAGLLYPLDIFRASGQNGLFQAQKGQWKTERWIKEKGMYGYMEWHSNTYYEEDLLACLNVYDFGESNGPTRLMAGMLLELTVAIMASHSYRGILATTHGRSYEEMVMHPELESIQAINWLLFGQPDRLAMYLSIGAVALASSAYRPHPGWEAVAASEAPLETRSSMGLFPRESMSGVDSATFRTASYMVSGMAGSKAGERGHQVHAGQVLLNGRVPVFVTSFDSMSEMTRPSYWGGQSIIPDTFAYRNVLAFHYRMEGEPGYSHCYFPMDQLDEVTRLGDWLFGRSGEAYIGVFSGNPYTVTDNGPYRQRELLCLHKTNLWLMEAGSRSESGSFEAFAAAITGARLQREGDVYHYDSPSQGPLKLAYGASQIGEAPYKTGAYPLIDNPFAYGEYGSGLVELKPPGGSRRLNFHL
ncbi:hypothetical protein [Paenibacillus sp. 1P07SE]|uniref:hypothetical protein n=1 Tax=Paenibacillus sp. 1P07SE TaxID=3132209 RepID=UPI0039A67247